VGAIGFFGVILIMIMRHDWYAHMFWMSTELMYLTNHLIRASSSIVCLIWTVLDALKWNK
jgi:hypothetical protein